MIAKQIADILRQEELGVPVYYSAEPPDPVQSITVFDTGNEGSDASIPLDRPTFQVRTKTMKYNFGVLLQNDIKTILQSYPKTDIDNYGVLDGIWFTSGWFNLTPSEDKQQRLLVSNYRCALTLSEKGNRKCE